MVDLRDRDRQEPFHLHLGRKLLMDSHSEGEAAVAAVGHQSSNLLLTSLDEGI